jgi:hypothetical protein
MLLSPGSSFHTPGQGSHDHEILHHVTVLELMLDGVCMVWTGLLEESLEVVCRQPHLALAVVCSSHNMTHAGAICFLIIAAVIVHRSCNPQRALLAPLLATLGALLGIMVGDIRRYLLTAAQGRLPAGWGKVKSSCLIAGGILGGDTAQLLGGVPKNNVWCLEGWWLLCVTHATHEHLCPWPLGVTVVSPLVIVFTLAFGVTHPRLPSEPVGELGVRRAGPITIAGPGVPRRASANWS